MRQEMDFLEKFGKIDDDLVECAGREWKGQKRYVFRLYGRRIACAAMVLLLGCAAAGNSNVQAAVRNFTTKIGEIIGFKQDLSSYTEVMNQTQVQNGVSLTLKEVILDDRVLLVSVHTDFGEKEGSVWVNKEKTLINGKQHMTYRSMQSVGVGSDLTQTQRDMVLAEVYENQILPEGDVEVHLVLEAGELREGVLAPTVSGGGEAEAADGSARNGEVQAAGRSGDSAETEFVYDFVITPEELRASTKRQELDIVIEASEAGRKDLQLKTLTMNDLYCKIVAEGVTWDDDWANQYDFKLKGTDSLGNPVSLMGGTFLSENEMLFATDFSGDYEAGEAIAEDEFEMSVPDKECEYLDLQLYERKMVWEEEEDGVYREALYSEEDNYGWKAVGKPVRIAVERD